MSSFIARHKVVFGLLAIAVAAAIFLGVKRLRGIEVDVVQVREQSLVQTVVATGRVMSPARVEVGSVITGRVAKVAVREGDKVEAGQTLLELDRRELSASLKQAEAAEQSARIRLANISELGLVTAEESLAQAKATMEWNQAELNRYRELRASGFISQSRLDEVERASRVAKSQYDSAHTQMQSQKQGGVQAREAMSKWGEAIAARDFAAAKLEQATIRADTAARILTRTVEPGDVVQPGKPLLTIATAGETRITAQIDEKNLPFIKEGDQAIASADAFPDAKFRAVVYYVAPSVDVQRGAVEARLRVPEPPAHLRADMTLSVEIVGARKDRVLVVPASAVRGAADGASSVLTIVDGKAVIRGVKLGLRGGGNVEIKEGLKADEEVILSSEIVPGMRVRGRAIASERVTQLKP
ncbi:MAG TPA: efflux RND transporter periplasmic adaptor subunit [Burkholderiales bacterium]|nr:efflux RND transporter periplasmic adaptor subunit [Burkholderiales bacterium]